MLKGHARVTYYTRTDRNAFGIVGDLGSTRAQQIGRPAGSRTTLKWGSHACTEIETARVLL